MRRQFNTGQILVESALILPLMVLIAVIFLSVFLVCRQLMRMNAGATEMATLAATNPDPLALQTSQAKWLLERMGGRATPPLIQRNSERIPRWRKAKGFSVVDGPGHLVHIDMKQVLLPHFCGAWLLPLLQLHVAADAPMETTVPQEE